MYQKFSIMKGKRIKILNNKIYTKKKQIVTKFKTRAERGKICRVFNSVQSGLAWFHT